MFPPTAKRWRCRIRCFPKEIKAAKSLSGKRQHESFDRTLSSVVDGESATGGIKSVLQQSRSRLPRISMVLKTRAGCLIATVSRDATKQTLQQEERCHCQMCIPLWQSVCKPRFLGRRSWMLLPEVCKTS